MRLYVIRHAEAEPEPPGGSDESRALTGKGMNDARKIGQAMNALGVSPAVIWTSPYLRAMQTADGIASALKSKACVAERDFLGIPGDFNELRQALKDEGSQNLALVGHMPFLGECVRYWISGQAHPGLHLAKSSVLCLEAKAFNRNGMQLIFMLDRSISAILAESGN